MAALDIWPLDTSAAISYRLSQVDQYIQPISIRSLGSMLFLFWLAQQLHPAPRPLGSWVVQHSCHLLNRTWPICDIKEGSLALSALQPCFRNQRISSAQFLNVAGAGGERGEV